MNQQVTRGSFDYKGLSRKAPRILVVGDFMWDVYWCGDVKGMSAEAAGVPKVLVSDKIRLPGGAGNVTANLQALGAQVHCLSGVGNIVKNRLMVGDQQLARWDENDYCSGVNPDLLADYTKDIEAVVVSDYNKGSVTVESIDILNACGLPLFVDTKGSPRRFSGRAVFFPNMAEYTQYSGEYYGLRVVLKCSGKGLYEYQDTELVGKMPALAKDVRSVNGAGDTVIAAYTFARLSGLWEPLGFAAVAAALTCEKPYTSVNTLEEVCERIGARA